MDVVAPCAATKQEVNRPMITIACEEGADAIVEKAATKKEPMFLAWNEVETYEDGLVVNKVNDSVHRSVESRRWKASKHNNATNT